MKRVHILEILQRFDVLGQSFKVCITKMLGRRVRFARSFSCILTSNNEKQTLYASAVSEQVSQTYAFLNK